MSGISAPVLGQTVYVPFLLVSMQDPNGYILEAPDGTRVRVPSTVITSYAFQPTPAGAVSSDTTTATATPATDQGASGGDQSVQVPA